VHQLVIKVLNIIDAWCNHEIYAAVAIKCSKLVLPLWQPTKKKYCQLVAIEPPSPHMCRMSSVGSTLGSRKLTGKLHL